jgi:hypothetical protein
VVRDRTVGERNSCERHYYISSRKLSAKRFLEVIRGHWGIENSLYWVLDVAFDEDQSRVRKDHGPENFALVRRLALSMLRAEGSKGSIRGKRLIAGWTTTSWRNCYSISPGIRCDCPGLQVDPWRAG